jgi:hypothetical protein
VRPPVTHDPQSRANFRRMVTLVRTKRESAVVHVWDTEPVHTIGRGPHAKIAEFGSIGGMVIA